jgi:hypothetical protein
MANPEHFVTSRSVSNLQPSAGERTTIPLFADGPGAGESALRSNNGISNYSEA